MSTRLPRLLALDLDGSAVMRGGRVHESDSEAVRKLQALGVIVTIATGRLYSGTRRAAADLGIQAEIACMNGSERVDTRTGDYRCEALHEELVSHGQLVTRNHGLASFVFARSGIHLCRANESYRGYLKSWSDTLVIHESVHSAGVWRNRGDILALCGAGRKTAIQAASDDLHRRTDGAHSLFQFDSSRGSYSFFEFRDFRNNKGTAVTEMAAVHGIAPAECVCLGDWLNDLPMFGVCGRSFAMGQAPLGVKQAATDLCESSCFTGGAVAEVARRVWGV